MNRREMTLTVDLAMRTWAPRVAEAALPFEKRWTRRAVRNYDPSLATAFQGALNDYEHAMDYGTASEVNRTGERLVRAYNVISARMGSANVPEDAYMVGRDPKTKTEIVIAETPAAAEHARQKHQFAIFFSPDEIASMVALDERAKKIAAVKVAFPGAEITNITTGDDDADNAD
jgi:hypothetical protein